MKKKSQNKILVVGSVAFDVIFCLNSSIRDQINIEDGKAGKQNLMFTAKNKEEFFGGTAGNISYGLSLLGEKPILFSSVGKDFCFEYEKRLISAGVDSRVYVDKKGWSPVYYGMTDTLGEQFGVWQPNAYGDHIANIALVNTIKADELKNISYAIFSPGIPQSIINHMRELREINKNAVMIFDPGQSIAALYDKNIFNECIELCDIFMANDTEVNYAKKHFGLNIKRLAEKGRIIIETKGEKGSVVHIKDGLINIPAFKPNNLLDVTGAGDAYRAGLLHGLNKGLSLEKAGIIGAKMASKCIEHFGGQNYAIPVKEIIK